MMNLRIAERGLRPERRSFTLIELLAVMAIFAILLSMVLAAVVSAEAFARKSHTQDLINRLSALIMNKWNTYQTRRVPIYIDPTKYTPAQAAKLQLDALHELMRLEMPDRLSDINDNPVTTYVDPTGATVTMQRPSASIAYQKYLAAQTTVAASRGTNAPNTLYQGAECLYMIITLGTEEGAGREFFKESDVGDVDNDSLPEFIDGWGNPIRFLRWAPAFIPANGADTQLQSDETIKEPNGQTVYKSPDPFDPHKVYGGYALYPLIYSAGPDGITDIQADLGTALRYSTISNNPFDASVKGQIGLPTDVNEGNISKNGTNDWYDNIHNHFNVID